MLKMSIIYWLRGNSPPTPLAPHQMRHIHIFERTKRKAAGTLESRKILLSANTGYQVRQSGFLIEDGYRFASRKLAGSKRLRRKLYRLALLVTRNVVRKKCS